MSVLEYHLWDLPPEIEEQYYVTLAYETFGGIEYE